MQHVGMYHNNKYTAYFYDYKIVIQTPHQTFKIRHFSYRKRCPELVELRQMIESGEIDRLDKLRTFDGVLIYEHTSIPCLN